MSDTIQTRQEREWQVLQTQFASHETHALCLRLTATSLLILVIGLGWSLRFLAFALLTLWLLEAMIRATQTRLGNRLLLLETGMRHEADVPGLQLHSWWATQRGGLVALTTTYVQSALRPTVALPYALLLAANLYAFMR